MVFGTVLDRFGAVFDRFGATFDRFGADRVGAFFVDLTIVSTPFSIASTPFSIVSAPLSIVSAAESQKPELTSVRNYNVLSPTEVLGAGLNWR